MRCLKNDYKKIQNGRTHCYWNIKATISSTSEQFREISPIKMNKFIFS